MATKRKGECCDGDNNGKIAKTDVILNVASSREEWVKKRIELLEEEKRISRARADLARKRRDLPALKLEEDYLLQGENGPVKFSSLFSGDNNNLVVYHMMMDEGAEKACHLCSFWIDGFNGSLPHLLPRTNVVAIAKGNIKTLQRFKAEKGWNVAVYSSGGTSFNRDCGVEMTANDKTYNYNRQWTFGTQAPGISVFHKNGDDVFHTYSTYAAGLADFNVVFSVLDILPEGRNEGARHMYWVKHKEAYGKE